MRRVFIQGPLSDVMEVTGEAARHMGFSLRLAAGERIGVAGQGGCCGEAEIVRITPASVTLALRQTENSPEPPVNVWLAQALPKGDKMDHIVQKAVELGVRGLFPVWTKHCVVRYDVAKQAEKVRRWQKIAQEAASQSGRGIVPPVKPCCRLDDLFSQVPSNAQVLMLYEGAGKEGLKAVLTRSAAVADWLLLVGPEGGFAEDEVVYCRQKGARLAGLGPRILRTETAPLAALASILYERGDLGGA